MTEDKKTIDDKIDENLDTEMAFEGDTTIPEEDNKKEEIPKIDESKNRVQELEMVINNLNDKLLRTLADSENFRRRCKEDLEKTSKYAISNFAGDLVMVMENFYLAVENMPKEAIEKSPDIKHFADAVVMTKKELTKVFEKNGIKRLSPIGEKFDHNFHDAVARIESDGEEGQVIKVIQAGYLIHDRLIRPALVGVSVKTSGAS
jgi:molecular chaperone GrpE